MWCISFSLLGIQYVIGDVIDVEITSLSGTPLQSHILHLIDQEDINERTSNIVSGNYQQNSTFYDRVETFTTSTAFVAWEIVTLLSGTYIFNLLTLFDIPPFFVSIVTLVYIILLARAIIGYVRGN